MMDGLCGTSSQWLFDVPALEPQFNKSGEYILYLRLSPSL